MLGRTDSRARMVAILLVFVVFATAAGLRLSYWQVVAAPELAIKAVASLPKPEAVHMERAPIVDRNGKTLARTVAVHRLDVYPNIIKPEAVDGIVTVLSDILELTPDQEREYREVLSSDRKWAYLKLRLTQQESADIAVQRAERRLPGIDLTPIDLRRYPGNGGQGGTTLASHLVGFVAGDGRGATGVERLYDDRLTSSVPVSADIASLPGLPLDTGEVDAPPLALTIDSKLQRQLEKELTAARLATRAKSVSAVIMDPRNGEILASASAPGYDANNYAEVATDHKGLLRDPVVSDTFEPGSVMKIFTATAALDNGVVTPQTKIKDEANIQFYKYRVDNSDKKGKGMISVKDVIAYSRNVAVAKIAQRLAPKSTRAAAHRLYELWDKVGLVGRTGVDIAGEEAGIYCDPDAGCPWAPVDLANRAFGQGVSVTLLQLANGVSTLVNGGYRVQPHVVAESDAAQVPPRRVLTAKVARQAQEILEHVTGAVPWYARGALIPGYMIGGKTGTAQIWDSRTGDWKDNIFNHNFVGYVGGNKPAVVIALRIEEPKAKVLGQGIVEIKIESYELFQNIARGAIKHLHIRKSKDSNAGLPIIGTQAARELTPQRSVQSRKEATRQRDGSTDASTTKRDRADRADKAKRGKKPQQRSQGREP